MKAVPFGMSVEISVGKRKSALRHRLLALRKEIPPAERARRCRAVEERCLALPLVRKATLLSSYIGYAEEIDTSGLVRALLSKGRRVAVPTRRIPGGFPGFSEIRGWEELIPDSLGILEPKEECLRPVAADSIPLFFVPGVAFDVSGRRLGYGLGFYDRALSRASENSVFAGLAFETQVVEELPEADHDIPMDIVITEKRIRGTSSKAVEFTEEVF